MRKYYTAPPRARRRLQGVRDTHTHTGADGSRMNGVTACATAADNAAKCADKQRQSSDSFR